MITNTESGTNVHEVADGSYRNTTPLSFLPGGFSFNQYLIVDDEPLLFHTGPRKLFPVVREAVAAVMPVERLRYVGLSHFEADECGSLNEWLAPPPRGAPPRGGVPPGGSEAGRSTSGSPPRRGPRPSAAASPRWSQSATWPTARRARSPTASRSR